MEFFWAMNNNLERTTKTKSYLIKYIIPEDYSFYLYFPIDMIIIIISIYYYRELQIKIEQKLNSTKQETRNKKKRTSSKIQPEIKQLIIMIKITK